MSRSRHLLLTLLTAIVTACGPSSHESASQATPTPSATETATPPPTPVPTQSGPTVGEYISGTCTTSVVRPLSIQLITELDCIMPGAVSEIPADNQINASGIFDYLQTKPGNSLPIVVNDRAGVTLHLNSALRSLAQQYLLYEWYLAGRCNIPLAATPGTSNHERGLAVDVQDSTGWRAPLQNHSWHWIGSSDPVHYDYTGSGVVNIQGTSVLAFQRLWNLNHPGDTIAEDGAYGPATATRLKKSPVNGFPQGSTCGAQPFAGYSYDAAADTEPETCAL